MNASTRSSSLEPLEARIAPARIFGVDSTNHLISFESETPQTVTSIPITGLQVPATESIKGLDFRPANGALYGLGINNTVGPDEGRIYVINTTTGVASVVNATPFSTTLQDGDDYGFDFNPVADRIRVVTDRDENIRVNPNTGNLAGTDTVLTPGTAALVGAAYDRNFDGTAKTTLYAIDHTTNSLVTIGGIDGVPSPNGGTVNTVGALGVSLGSFQAGFDIESRTGLAYATLRDATQTGLYSINLATGAATLMNLVGGNPLLHGMTVALPNDLTIVSATTATYTDQDGDKVTVKVTGAAASSALTKEDFTFATGAFGLQLRLLNLADDGQKWAHASISINAVPTGAKGDSFANIGYINATGVDLGKVSVNGDLSQIDAGDAGAATPGLASLTVRSLGFFSNTQLPESSGAPDQVSSIVGKLGALSVKTDMTRSAVDVIGGADGSIGTVSVGGDIIGLNAALNESGIFATGSIGTVKVGGSLFGGSAASTGNIVSGGLMGSVSVGGSIFGGTAPNTGVIESGTNMGAVVVKGSVIGGTDDHTGNIHSTGSMKSVTIDGSIIGGTVVDPVTDFDSGIVYAYGFLTDATCNIGPVKIGGNLEGANGQFSGSLYALNALTSVTVTGSLKGASGGNSGNIQAGTKIAAVKIGGDVTGSSGAYSGSIYTFLSGSIGGVTIGGSLVGGNALTGIISGSHLGAVKIAGEVRASVPGGVRISAPGDVDPATPALGLAITSVTVTGSVKNALILGGYNEGGIPVNPDASIGAIKAGGDWIASSVIAGTQAGPDTLFGTADDIKILETTGDTVVSKIASITITGMATGTVGGADNYGFVSEQIGAVKVGLRTFTLAAGTDTAGLAIGTTNDLRVREV